MVGDQPGAATSVPLLAMTAAQELVLPTVREVHRAVSDASFRWTGPLGRPVQRVVEQATDTAYLGVQGVLAAVTAGLRRLACAPIPASGLASPPTRRATRTRAIAAGVVDAGVRARAGLSPAPMSLYLAGRPEPVMPEQLPAVVPGAGGRLVVFVHGLVDTEHVWYGGSQGPSLPAVAAGSGAQVLLVRYDTGRSIGGNAADLAELLERVFRAWPVRLRRLVLVGYSMGGLVIRGATQQAEGDSRLWPSAVSDVVHLATPHLGSWLEKSANVASWTLRHASAVSAPFGHALDRRSEGIKDLRFGAVGAAGHPPVTDGLLQGWHVPSPWPSTTRHHLVAGRLRPRPGHPLNLVVGDALVRAGSARGVGALRAVPGPAPASYHEVAAGHLDLVRHAEVAAVLRTVLDEPVTASLTGSRAG